MSPWFEVASGLSIGEVGRPFEGEFDYVLTISPLPPLTSDAVRHRWLVPTSAQLVRQAGRELAPRWLHGKRLLVQSIPTVWADLAVAACLVHSGASPDEAISALRRARPVTPSDDQLRAHLEGR